MSRKKTWEGILDREGYLGSDRIQTNLLEVPVTRKMKLGHELYPWAIPSLEILTMGNWADLHELWTLFKFTQNPVIGFEGILDEYSDIRSRSYIQRISPITPDFGKWE